MGRGTPAMGLMSRKKLILDVEDVAKIPFINAIQDVQAVVILMQN